jgi:hypothetical protein
MFSKRSTLLATALLFGLCSATPSLAAPAWVEQGPGPILNAANVQGLPGPNPAAGAINAIVADPMTADIVFVGTVNGGVWRTSNATAATPTWTPLTDQQLPALSINSLAMSPVSPSTLFAGTGSTSSLSFRGSSGFGVARSTNFGATWIVLARSTFAGRRIDSIVPTQLSSGNVVLAATLFDRGGVYRSTDNGVTFTRISDNGTSGLPDAGVSNLIADPSNVMRFYAGVPANFGGGAAAGVYRSDDGGVTWTSFSTGLTGLSTSLRILLSVHNDATNNVVYADVINTGGTLSGVFRSTNQGGSWTSLGVPAPPIYPGGQVIYMARSPRTRQVQTSCSLPVTGKIVRFLTRTAAPASARVYSAILGLSGRTSCVTAPWRHRRIPIREICSSTPTATCCKPMTVAFTGW